MAVYYNIKSAPCESESWREVRHFPQDLKVEQTKEIKMMWGRPLDELVLKDVRKSITFWHAHKLRLFVIKTMQKFNTKVDAKLFIFGGFVRRSVYSWMKLALVDVDSSKFLKRLDKMTETPFSQDDFVVPCDLDVKVDDATMAQDFCDYLSKYVCVNTRRGASVGYNTAGLGVLSLGVFYKDILSGCSARLNIDIVWEVYVDLLQLDFDVNGLTLSPEAIFLDNVASGYLLQYDKETKCSTNAMLFPSIVQKWNTIAICHKILQKKAKMYFFSWQYFLSCKSLEKVCGSIVEFPGPKVEMIVHVCDDGKQMFYINYLRNFLRRLIKMLRDGFEIENLPVVIHDLIGCTEICYDERSTVLTFLPSKFSFDYSRFEK